MWHLGRRGIRRGNAPLTIPLLTWFTWKSEELPKLVVASCQRPLVFVDGWKSEQLCMYRAWTILNFHCMPLTAYPHSQVWLEMKMSLICKCNALHPWSASTYVRMKNKIKPWHVNLMIFHFSRNVRDPLSYAVPVPVSCPVSVHYGTTRAGKDIRLCLEAVSPCLNKLHYEAQSSVPSRLQ